MSLEELGGSIEAYTYPPEFAECDGSATVKPGVRIGQQKRKAFGFCYRTLIGNDSEGTAYGYKLHLIYGCLAKPTEQANATVNDSPEAKTMSFEFTTTPVEVTVGDATYTTASIEIDSTKVAKEKLAALEATDSENKSTLKYASDVLGLFGQLFELVEDPKHAGKYFVKAKGEDKDMFFDVSTEGGKKAFAYLAPILLPNYKNTGKKKEDAAAASKKEGE
jgi:hypothetical protein